MKNLKYFYGFICLAAAGQAEKCGKASVEAEV